MNRACFLQAAFAGSFRLQLVGILALLSGCARSPTNEDATQAVKDFVRDGGTLVQMAASPSAWVKTVNVGECKDASPLDGQYCAINVVSEDIPLLGAVAIPIVVRFSRDPSGWKVFLN